MAPLIDEATLLDFTLTCGLVLALTLAFSVCSQWFDIHAGKELAVVPRGKVTVEQRADASDKLLCIPYFAVVSGLALVASWELRATPEMRWHGETVASRRCMLLYCAKQAVDVPVQVRG